MTLGFTCMHEVLFEYIVGRYRYSSGNELVLVRALRQRKALFAIHGHILS